MTTRALDAIDRSARWMAIATAAIGAAVHGGLLFGVVDAMNGIDGAEGVRSSSDLPLAGTISTGASFSRRSSGAWGW